MWMKLVMVMQLRRWTGYWKPSLIASFSACDIEKAGNGPKDRLLEITGYSHVDLS